MTTPDRFDSAVAEAPPASQHAAATPKAAARLELQGDEVIQFTIKPSLWFIPLVASRWVLAMGLLLATLTIAQRTGWTREGAIAFNVALGVIVLRIALATLQWASKLYVLTNRRVMCFRGALNVTVTESPLAKLSAADLAMEWYQRPLRLGTIRMARTDDLKTTVLWEHLAHPTEIHERLLRAIRRAQS